MHFGYLRSATMAAAAVLALAPAAGPARAADPAPDWSVRGPPPPGPWRFFMPQGADAGCTLVSQPEAGVTVTLSDAHEAGLMGLFVTGESVNGDAGTIVDIAWRGPEATLSLAGRIVAKNAAGARISPLSDPDRLSASLIRSETVLSLAQPGGTPRLLGLAAANPKVLELYIACLRHPSQVPRGFSYGPQEAAKEAAHR